jgi:hypothetical protein
MAVASHPGTGRPTALAVIASKQASCTERAKKEAPYSSSHRL